MTSLDSEDLFSNLPYELLECILQYLTVEDLCHVATCSRVWREAANSDLLWRPLCRQKGWERYGTVTDLCKETSFAPVSQEQDTDQISDNVSFPNDSLVNGSAWPGLADTCKWKEVYMKARHLEANWRNNRYHVVSFEFGSVAMQTHWGVRLSPLNNLDGEGSSLAGSVGNWNRREQRTMRIWDVTNGHCRHIIKVDASKERHALKMKNGIVVVGCEDGKIRTYSVQTGEQLHVFSGHRRAVTRLFFDGETIVSVAQCRYFPCAQFEDNDVRVWSSADGSSRFVFQSISRGTQLVDLDYLDKTVAVAYDDNVIRLWDVRTGTYRGTIVTGGKEIVSCNLGDGFVISSSKGNDIRMWNLDSGECMKIFDVPGVDFERDDPDDGRDDIICSILSGELLLVHSDGWVISIFNLNGKYAGDEFMCERLICVHGNKIVSAWTDERNELHLIDRLDRFTVQSNSVQYLRSKMEFDKIDDLEYSMAWMSDTKLAFVQYHELEDPVPLHLQKPKIFVYHYW